MRCSQPRAACELAHSSYQLIHSLSSNSPSLRRCRSGTEFPRLLFYFYREFVAVGGLMSYFADLLDSYRIAGTS